jgi:predicted small lipoprotein YifL
MTKKSLIALSAVACFALAGCGEKGPAEQAGEKVDQAVEQVKEMADDAAQRGAAEKAGEKVDAAIGGQSAEPTDSAVKDAAQDAGQQGPAEKAGEAIDEKTEQMKEDAGQE